MAKPIGRPRDPATRQKSEKVCPQCKLLRPIGDYWRSKTSADGYASWCKECSSKQNKADRQKRVLKWKQEDAREAKSEKFCSKCLLTKSTDLFNLNDHAPDGLYHWCRECQKSEMQMRKWGKAISPGDLCEICKAPHGFARRRLSIDHDHKTGEFRGILCNHCNVGLGAFDDEPERLEEAARYLRSRS